MPEATREKEEEMREIRKWLADILWPRYPLIENNYYSLQSDIEYAYRWLGEFKQICAVLDWVRGKYVFGEADIYQFRERLRRQSQPHNDKI